MFKFQKQVQLFLFLMCCSACLWAQEYDEGDFYGQLGVGLAQPIYGEDHQTQIPLVTLNIAKAITDNITVGGVLGYTASRSTAYRFQGDHYFYQHQYALIMLRSAWHQEVFDLDKFDVYGGLSLGAKIARAQYRGRGELANLEVNAVPAQSGFIYHVFLGAHYYHSDALHLYLEGGLGYSPVALGLHFSF